MEDKSVTQIVNALDGLGRSIRLLNPDAVLKPVRELEGRERRIEWRARLTLVAAIASAAIAALAVLVGAVRVAGPAPSAWVLWFHSTPFYPREIGRDSWEILGAEETRSACNQRRDATVKVDFEGGSSDIWRRERGKWPGGIEGVTHTRTDMAGVQIVKTWLCLPAGTDPRPRSQESN